MADMTATGYHPKVEHFLNRNTQLNNEKNIAFERINWEDDNNKLGRFDLIIGSDLYEDQHVALLAYFIQNHANKNVKLSLLTPVGDVKTNSARK